MFDYANYTSHICILPHTDILKHKQGNKRYRYICSYSLAEVQNNERGTREDRSDAFLFCRSLAVSPQALICHQRELITKV